METKRQNEKPIVTMVWLALITLLSACMTEQAQASLILVEEWVARHNSPSWGGTIVLDGSGTVYVAGTVNNASTSDDYLTVAYDSAGHLLWEAHYDGVASAEDHAIGMASGPSGNVYVTGRSKSTPSWIGYDYTTVAYDSSGNQQWVARYNGPWNGRDWGTAIASRTANEVYVTAVSDGNLVIIKYSLAFDTDDDGVPDDEDACPDSDLSPTVVIDGCDSGVANHLFDDGCTISDLIAIYAAEANNHGQFASSVSQFANDLVQAGLISGADKGQIQNCAAQADIP